MVKYHITIVAAGSGRRFGAPLPKQFCILGGRPVICHTIGALRRALPDAPVTVVVSADEIDRMREICKNHDLSVDFLAKGGDTRWASVRNGLETVAGDTDIVLVHDGARPFPSQAMIDRLLKPFSNASVQGTIPVVPVTDSLRLVEPDGSSVQIDRAPYRNVQTPQAFRWNLLKAAYGLPYCSSFTDDASVMETAGYKNLILTEGDTRNIKITNPQDLRIAELFLDE